ncbi:hypothetical protein SAMN05428949_0654 [Chitinophaga sp. YR627]|uniref:hypothetical protein n=1 Tax=Chitinophaga sp. YR627 TaxID=1881041 RepID=UPI0008E80626|nr:hypothetical protein [Chitinophaga sp. YR627]SFM74852.1 hypothetical protein SAMN05428949_0654 [Chitinophaga sp. YR627]
MKFKINEILHVFKHGLACLDISIGMLLKELQNIYGFADEVIGDSNAGYLRYSDIRIGYFGDYIDEVAITFDKDPHFKIEIEGLEDLKHVDREMKMNQFIHILNYAGLRWSSKYRDNHLDYVSIGVEEGSDVLFDLETGRIMRIALLEGEIRQNHV